MFLTAFLLFLAPHTALAASPAALAVEISPWLRSFIKSGAGQFLLFETPEGLRFAQAARVGSFQDEALAREFESQARRIASRIGAAQISRPSEAGLAELRLLAREELAPGRFELMGSSQSYTSARDDFMEALPEPFDNEWFPIRRIPKETLNEYGASSYQPQEARSEVMFGASESGDFWLIAGKKKYAGLVGGAPLVQDISGGAQISQGLWVRFADLPPETIQNLVAVLGREPQSITISCANGGLRRLADAGVHIGGEGDFPLYRYPTLKRVLTDGFRSPDGKRYKAEIWMSSEKSLTRFMSRMQGADRLLKPRVQSLLDELKGRQFTPDEVAQSIGKADPDTRRQLLVILEKGLPVFVVVLVLDDSRE